MFEDFCCYYNEPLKNHCTFKIGGNADYFLIPKNTRELKKIILICKQKGINFFIIGNGSNILFDSKGFSGAIISLKNFNKIMKLDGNSIQVQAGVNLFKFNQYCANHGYSNFEWSYGIPGTIGGAIKMNAGAYDHCFMDYVTEITLLKNNKIVTITDFKYSYRESCIFNEIILSAKIEIVNKTYNEILVKMNNYFNQRKSSQPLSFPSAGSVFKRDNDIIPAQIIDRLGFKGLYIGGAMISKKHAGFIINFNQATSKDVLNLIKIIKKATYAYNINLNEEIIYLPYNKKT